MTDLLAFRFDGRRCLQGIPILIEIGSRASDDMSSALRFGDVDGCAGVALGADIRIELRRGAIAVNVTWLLLTSSAECARPGCARSSSDPRRRRVAAVEPLDLRADTEAVIAQRDCEAAFKQAIIDKLTHEMAVLKRLKFAAKSESFSAEQTSLIEEAIDADLAALAREIEQIESDKQESPDRQQPSARSCRRTWRAARSAMNPRARPAAGACAMKRIGEEIAEKLDYQPGVFTVQRHVRGK